MVEHSKLHRDDVASTSFNSVASQLDLTSQVKGPLGTSTGGVQNRSYIVSQDYRGEEADIYISRELENVFILPGGCMSDKP